MDVKSTKEILSTSMSNVSKFYNDVSTVFDLVEQSMRSGNYKALGNAGVHWENNSAYYSDSWLPRYAARVYQLNQKDNNVLLGLCIHMGDYEKNWMESLPEYLSLPFLNVARLEIENGSIEPSLRKTYWNILWGAGWYIEENAKYDVKDNIWFEGKDDYDGVKAKVEGYHLDFFKLLDETKILNLIVEPLKTLANQPDGYRDQILDYISKC